MMIVVRDVDSVPPEHAVAFFELLGGGKKDASWDGPGMSSAQLAILPVRYLRPAPAGKQLT